MTQNTPLRAVIYTRISRDVDGEGRGVARQEEACRALCASRGWEVTGVFTENDTSAMRGQRPKYRDVVDLAKNGHVEVIVAWAVDRLTRSPREIEDLITLSESTGVIIATASGDLDLTTDSGRLVGRILASVARGEVERKGARQRLGNLQRAREGRPPTRRALGYAVDGSVIEDEAAEVRAAFAAFAAGAGVRTIMRDWNSRGILNTHGGSWSNYGVSALLRNPRYVAERWLEKRSNNQRGVPPEYIGPGGWEPLVTKELFETVQARFADQARQARSRGEVGIARKHFGSGLYRCGICDDGTKVRIQHAHTKYRRKDGTVTRSVKRCYVCREYSHLHRGADDVDNHVQAEVVAYLRKNRLAELMADDRDVAAARALRDEEVELLARLDSFEVALAEGDLTPKQVRGATERVQARLDQIRVQQATAGERSALALLEGSTDPGQAFLDLPVSEQVKVADALAEITLHKGARGRAPFDPATVTIDWRATPR